MFNSHSLARFLKRPTPAGSWFVVGSLRGRRRRQPARYVPVVRGLEDRLVPSTFQEFPVPGALDHLAGAHITVGPDGNLWYTHFTNRAIGRIAPDGGVTEFPIQIPIDDLFGITTGPDGNLWIGTSRFSPSFPNDQAFILRMTPDGDQTYFRARLDDGVNTNDFIGGFHGPTVGPDGNLWYHMGLYTSPNEDFVGRITPDGTVANFILGSTLTNGLDGEFSGGIAVGADGNFWCSLQSHSALPGWIYRINTDGQVVGVINTTHGLGEMTAGPDGNVWGVERGGDGGELIERITLDGIVTDFPFPTQTHDRSHNYGMSVTAGPDGNIWFTEPAANQIGMITPDGQITEYQVPTPNSHPTGITAGPDGNIWFTELGSGQIGEFVLNDGTGPAATSRSSPALAQALRATAVDAVFTHAQQGAVSGVGGLPSATSAADASLIRLSQDLTMSSTQSAAADVSGLHHHPARVADPAALADPLADIL